MSLDPLTRTRANLNAIAIAFDTAIGGLRADLMRLPPDDPQRSTLHLAIEKLLDIDTEISELIDSFDDLEDEADPPTYERRIVLGQVESDE
jgi:hypothetical protein